MKILFTNDATVLGFGLGPALRKIGEETDMLVLRTIPHGEQPEALERRIEAFRPDFIFTEGDPVNFNRPAVLDACRRHGIPIIYWAIQDPTWFNEISKYCAERADFVFTTTIELIEEYLRVGKKAHLLLFACNPDFHRRVAPVPEYRHDIVLVGSNYDRREAATRYMLEPLMKNGFDLMVWGHWWQNPESPFHLPDRYYSGLLPYEKLPQVYGSSRIVLGLHLAQNSITQCSVRSFEVLGCRAFYLTQYTPAHANLFKQGVHLDWARNEHELLDKVRFYLKHDNVRERIAQVGQAHVYEKHNYVQRARQMVDVLRQGVGK